MAKAEPGMDLLSPRAAVLNAARRSMSERLEQDSEQRLRKG